MQMKRFPFLLIVLLVAALGFAGYYAYTSFQPRVTGALTASGTVEATDVTIAPEISGRVTEVLVKEGDQVKVGDILFRLDDALLQAQRKAASAAMETTLAAGRTAEKAAAVAQSQVDLALNASLAEQKANRIADWTASQPAEFKQQAWYFEKSELLAAAQVEVSAAQAALVEATKQLSSVEETTTSGSFTSAEKRLLEARSAFEVAQIVRTTSSAAAQDLRDSAQKTYDDALAELTSAQKAYSEAATTSGASDILTARADLRIAQERYDTAQDRVRILQTGSLSPKVVAAQRVLDQALAAVEQSKIAVAQAEANLAVIDTQLSKMTVISPTDGFVLTRAIEPGEVVMPGSNLLTLARLSDLTITVYVPEDRYGELSVGQAAQITADSFPGEVFSGSVVNISGQAEFTPRNVQTTAGRKTTVFAIKLAMAKTDGKLKPGMPADVLFK